MGELATKIKVGIEEIILFAIIAVSVIGLLFFLPGDIAFLKKIVSWIGMGYLCYKIDLAAVFFGKKNKWVDSLLILSYFCLILKDFFAFAREFAAEKFILFDVTIL